MAIACGRRTRQEAAPGSRKAGRHAGDDQAIIAAHQALYTAARERNPARWSDDTRNWAPIAPVTLNPERDSVVNLAASDMDRQLLAA